MASQNKKKSAERITTQNVIHEKMVEKWDKERKKNQILCPNFLEIFHAKNLDSII